MGIAHPTDDYIYDGFTLPTVDYEDYFNSSGLNLNITLNLSNYSDWCEAGEQEQTIKIFQTSVFCLIFPLGIMGNSLVIATFALYRRLRLRSMTDVFLFHLALADLLLLFTLPLQGVQTHLGWIIGNPLCRATRACYAINTYSGLLLLACISVDRYLVVARAQQVLRLRRQILTAGKLVAVGVWLVAVLLSLPEICFSGVSDKHCGMQGSLNVKMAANGAIIAVFCLSFFVMVICYSSIALVLWEGQVHGRGKGWHRQRTLKLMVALVLVFLVFQLPYTVVLSRRMVRQVCDLLLQYITCTLAYTRCCLNPILYALVGVRFRNDVLRLIDDAGCLCGLHLRQQSDSCVSMSPSSPALTVLSAFSPTSPDRSHSSSETTPATKFQFPTSK